MDVTPPFVSENENQVGASVLIPGAEVRTLDKLLLAAALIT